MSHTPGPWVYKPFARTSRAFTVTADVTDAHRDIANVLGLASDNEDNARLIAEAPALLAALKALLESNSWREAWQSDELREAFVVAERAVARAEGREP